MYQQWRNMQRNTQKNTIRHYTFLSNCQAKVWTAYSKSKLTENWDNMDRAFCWATQSRWFSQNTARPSPIPISCPQGRRWRNKATNNCIHCKSPEIDDMPNHFLSLCKVYASKSCSSHEVHLRNWSRPTDFQVGHREDLIRKKWRANLWPHNILLLSTTGRKAINKIWSV